MGQTTDQLRQEIDAKRDDAAQKIDQIEQKVDAAAQQVKDKIDWRRQVDDNPMLALGAAFIGGMVLGGVLGGGDDNGRQPRADYGYGRYGQHDTSTYFQSQSGRSSSSGGIGGTIRNAAKSSGLEETIQSMSGTVMATVADRLREVADQSLPGLKERLGGGSSSSGGTSASAAMQPNATLAPGNARRSGVNSLTDSISD